VCAFVAASAGGIGCATAPRHGWAIDPGRLATEPGWLVAAPTPEIRERDYSECAPAALAMVAGRWFVAMSLDEAFAALPPPRPWDAHLDHLRDALRARGLVAYTVVGNFDTFEYEMHAHRPVIIGLMKKKGPLRSHYEVVVGVRPATKEVVTIDPARGWRVRRYAELEAEWQPAGRPALIVLGPRWMQASK
jgi:ABC-type bacteriocin/lantibiotic exporter with double-glycine peptidase domain